MRNALKTSRAWTTAQWLLLLIAWLGTAALAHATIKQPNGEYRETMDDLSVKVLGGYVTVSRTWQADDQNKGIWRWYFNPAWADLNFTFDSIDGSVKQITRADSPFTKTGTGVFVFDQVFFIKQTSNPAGWRWYDTTGNWITYDANGKITAYGDRNNVGVTFTRNGDGTINQIKDQNGLAVLTYGYTNGQVTSISDYSGRSVGYQYTNGQLTQVTDVLGYPWVYGYTGGLLTSKTDPNLHTTVITYKGNRVVKITDPMHYETNYSYDYDHFKRVYSVVETSPEGVRTETRYDTRGKVIYRKVGTRVVFQLVKDGVNVEISIDERGLQTRAVYDTLRNPIEIAFPDGTKITKAYDSIFSNVTSSTDEIGVETKYSYDLAGNLTKVTEAAGYPEQRITTYTYDTYGQRRNQTVKGMPIPGGITPGPNDTQYQDATTQWNYDQYGNVATVTDPLLHITSLAEDVMGNVITRVDPRHHAWSYEYNPKGWLKKTTDPLQHNVETEYDKVGNRTSTIDALNNKTTYVYNDNGWLTSTVDPPGDAGGTSIRGYDADGRLKQICDQLSVCANYGYDGDGRLLTAADGSGNITRVIYGDGTNGLQGQIAAIIYPTYQEQYRYDQRDRRTQAIQMLGGPPGEPTRQETTGTGYTPRGQVAVSTDALGRTTLTNYDALGRRIATTDALLGHTSYTYNNQNALIAMTDANGHERVFAYDLANRRISAERGPNSLRQYSYDDAGNMLERTSPEGGRRVYTYDAANRRTRQDLFEAGSNSASQSIEYEFDERNLLTRYTQTGDTQSSATYTYDSKRQKRMEAMTYGQGSSAFTRTVQHDYYANGLTQFLTYPDGTVITYGYNANNQLASATTPDGGVIQFTGYVWNMPTQVQMPGAVQNITLDSLERPLRIMVQGIGTGTANSPSGAALMNYQYVYDAAGNVIKRTTDDGEYNYNYDKLDRLVDAIPPTSVQASSTNLAGLPVEHYTYDALNNRTSSLHQPGNWSFSSKDELLNFGEGEQAQSYDYDLNGNVRRQLSGDPATPSRTRQFSYNVAERLARVTDDSGTNVQYRYDPFGRRIAKSTTGTTSWYLYADEGLIAEFSTARLDRIYGWSPHTVQGYGPLWLASKTSSGWDVSYSNNDVLGTTRLLTTAEGNVVWKGLSEAFGSTMLSVPLIENPLRLPGQYFDQETGLTYNMARDYDPIIGRFIESDPAGLRGGPNPYIYSGDNPLSSIDPTGQFNVNAQLSYQGYYRFRFSFDSPCIFNLIQPRKFNPIDFLPGGGVLLKIAKKTKAFQDHLLPGNAGIDDVDPPKQCDCLFYDAELKRYFLSQGWKEGDAVADPYGEDTYSESDTACILLKLHYHLRRIVREHCSDGSCSSDETFYPWDTIVRKAKTRATTLFGFEASTDPPPSEQPKCAFVEPD